MRHGISLVAAGHATSLLFAITFSICIAFDLLFPELAMYQVWLKLLPGFEWLTWWSFFLGLAESYGYGWFLVLIWVPLYNVFSARWPGKSAPVPADAWAPDQQVQQGSKR